MNTQRIGHDINITFSSFDGSIRENYSIDDLLPNKWIANKGATATANKAWCNLFPYTEDTALAFGDMIELDGKYIAMVWENVGDKILVKYKYELKPDAIKEVDKVPHSFCSFNTYIHWLKERDLLTVTNNLGDSSIISKNKITGYKPRMNLHNLGLNNITPLLDLFSEVGIPIYNVSVTGSRSMSLEVVDSDYDIVVKADYKSINKLQKLVLKKIDTDASFNFPINNSNTLSIIKKLNTRIQKRFFTTFCIQNGTSSLKISLIFIPEEHVALKISDANFLLKTVRAEVIESKDAKYKRAAFLIRELNTSKIYHCYCWHKLANLIEKGDIIDITGKTDGKNLYQLDPVKHSIHFIL